jgi:hypothetical protein
MAQPRHTPEQLQTVLDVYAAGRALRVRAGALRVAGWSGPAIARELGVPYTTVYCWLRADLPGLSRRATKAERRRRAA